MLATLAQPFVSDRSPKVVSKGPTWSGLGGRDQGQDKKSERPLGLQDDPNEVIPEAGA